VSTLGRRLVALEHVAWERRKREILHDALAEIAREEQWMPERLEREVQAVLDEFGCLEPELNAIWRRAGTLREAATLMAAELEVDPDELFADFEGSGVTLRSRSR
jgi:hypothetical protein